MFSEENKLASLDEPKSCERCPQCWFELVALHDSILRSNLPDDLEDWMGSICQGYLFKFSDIDLRIERGSASTLPKYRIQTRQLSRRLTWSLEDQLRDLIAHYAVTSRGVFVFTILVLQMVEATAAHLPKYHRHLDGKQEEDHAGWSVHDAKSWGEIRDNIHGVDLSTVPNTAQDILGLTPRQICEDILPDYRVVHVESTLMETSTQSLRRHVPATFRRSHEDIVDYLVKPRVTFHGTHRQLVSSIVQCGFLRPGDIHPVTGFPLPVRCGSTYGRGIYSSPDPHFALSYSGEWAEATAPGTIPGIKLLVCATIMGRTAAMFREDNWRDQNHPYPGSDSHVANNEKEYIVFDNAQILPCYVLHLDWGNVHDVDAFVLGQMTKKKHPKLSKEALSPGDVQRQKQERLAQAKKYFAYGFGPISGRNIVIEEIGEIDDDEEDYGEYQADRVESLNQEKVDIWRGPLEGETWVDEYADVRKAKIRLIKRHDSDDED
ncbi:hypothetical protein C8J56DRAFT_893928 [Mycena floridula]|nr:hypothetical protein C8J56DRAFT_893928 [Mycena floridula]